MTPNTAEPFVRTAMSPPTDTRALDARDEVFVIEYLIDLDVERAALKAGYSPSMAKSKCYQWVRPGKQNRKPWVYAAIRARMDGRARRVGLQADAVLAELGKLVFFDMGEAMHITADGDPYADLSKATPDFKAALTSFEIEDFVDRRERDEDGNVIARDVRRVKIKGPDKLGAINAAMKHLGIQGSDRMKIEDGEKLAEAMMAAITKAQQVRAE